MKDLALNPLTHDLEIRDQDILFVEKTDYIVQKLKIKLQFFLGEWFLDTSIGIPFFEEILIKNPNLPDIENLLKAAIIEVDGVNEILEFESNFSKSTRSLDTTFKVNTDYGIIDFSDTIF